MLGALTNLFHSEKAFAGGLLIIGSTVFVILGHMTVDAWSGYTQTIFGLYVGGKTVQGAAGVIAGAMASKTSTKVEKIEVKTDSHVDVDDSPAPRRSQKLTKEKP